MKRPFARFGRQTPLKRSGKDRRAIDGHLAENQDLVSAYGATVSYCVTPLTNTGS